MKKIFTIILLTLLGNIAAQAQDADYQPLVREGVVWHYEYFLFDDYTYESFAEDYKVQFRGDTLLNGVQYKKCFFYKEEHLPDGVKPICFAREANKQILFTEPDMALLNGASDNLCVDMGKVPGPFFETISESIVYDFNDAEGFAQKLNEKYPYEEFQIEKTEDVLLNGVSVNKYHFTSVSCDGDYVEGIGVDGQYTGYLFSPIMARPVCYCPMPMGLIKVTDLKGNMLYKGANFDDFNILAKTEEIGYSKTPLQVVVAESSLNIAIPHEGILTIIDMVGRVVTNRVVTDGTVQISTSFLSPGVYLVRLSDETGTETTKVIIN